MRAERRSGHTRLIVKNGRIEQVRTAGLVVYNDLKSCLAVAWNGAAYSKDECHIAVNRLSADVSRLTVENARLVAVGHKHGWNGVENSKILANFFDDELERVTALEKKVEAAFRAGFRSARESPWASDEAALTGDSRNRQFRALTGGAGETQ